MFDTEFPDFEKMAENQRRMPLSHQQLTGHLISKHASDICDVVIGLFKDFAVCDPKDRNQIAKTLLPYFFIKADVATSSNIMEELHRRAHNVHGLKPQQLTKLENLILQFHEENKDTL